MRVGDRDFVFRGKVIDENLYERIKLPSGLDNRAEIPEECVNLYELNISRNILTKEI